LIRNGSVSGAGRTADFSLLWAWRATPTFSKPAFKAGVDFHGVHDWAIFLPMWTAEVDAKNADVAPDIKEARDLAFKSSPVSSIANWRSPVLFVHGDDDRNVPFQQTTDLVEKLRAQNVAFEELIFPDEIHDLLRWSDWVRAYRATAEFFDRRLAASDERQ
jgi:Dipeptidyl aminopeptidases/acylaminoacyl-peptidases